MSLKMLRVRRSSMSSREEERILDEYRARFCEKAERPKATLVHQPRQRPEAISPYLQSVAPRNSSTHLKKLQTVSLKRQRRQFPSSYTEKRNESLVAKYSNEKSFNVYSSSFESSDSDDSNEKENHPKSILRKRPSSAPMHRRRHTHDGTTDTDSVKSDMRHSVPLFKRQLTTIRCMAYKNGCHEDGVILVASDVKQLLVEATRKLGLNTAGRRVYLEDGSEVYRAKDIPLNANVYVSQGEQFKDLKKAYIYSESTIVGRKPARRAASNRLRRLAGKQSSRILVFLNGDGANGQEVIFAKNDGYRRLLDQSTSRLKMNSAARTTFGWDGKEVSSFEQVRQLDSCMKDGSAMILGPLWISSGEGFNPAGALNFVEGILWGISKRLKGAKERSKQLDYACNGEFSKITHPDLITMAMDDIYTNIEQISDEIEEMKKVKKKYKERLKTLKEMKAEQEMVGNSYTMKHIKEIKSDNRIVGQHGLRLKIYENGRDTNGQQVFINMREILRGTEQEDKSEELIRMRFLENLSHWHKPLDPTGPAKSTLVRRLFNKDGDEIFNIKGLKNDQEIWLSYGGDFKPSQTMVLHVQLLPVMAYLVEGKDKVILLREGEVKLKADTKWEAHDGFPEDYNLLSVKSLEQKSKIFSPMDHYLQSKEDCSLVVKPILMGSAKFEKRPRMGTSQAWVVHRNGYITCRNFPQLALSLDEEQPVLVKMSCGAEVNGYALALEKKSRGNPRQQWEFSSSGRICSLFNSSTNQVLTILDGGSFNSVEVKGQLLQLKVSKHEDGNLPNQEQADTSLKVVALENLTGSRAKFQRWALKQETIPNQWKETKVANPAWKKLAYSWPVLPDGNWNLDYKWPMEGTFVSCPPHLRGREKRESTSTVPLKVLRNGEKNPKRFVPIVVPDLSASTLVGDKTDPEAAEAKVIRLEMNMLLERATSLLNLPFAARRIFNDRGGEIFSLRKVKRNQPVYVTCGETWQNPAVTKSEAQRRNLLAQLTADMKKIHEYCVLRDPGDVVVTMESGVVLGSRLVVTQQVMPEEEEAVPADQPKASKQTEVSEKVILELEKDKRTCHEISHEFSDNWVASRKYPWELEKTTQVEPQKEKEQKKSPRTPRAGQRSPRPPWLKNSRLLQKFTCKDGFLSPESEPTLAIGVPGVDLTTMGGAMEVQLCKKDVDDMTQRWNICPDGTIRLICDNTVGLTVCLPAISSSEEPSPKNYVLVLQKLKLYASGSANQRWQLDPKTHTLRAFYSNVTDKEVTAANHVSVCTYAVRGPEPLNQDGFIAELKESSSRDPVVVCRSCAMVMRGGKKYSLSHAPTNWSFICAMADHKKHGLKPQGSFRCLNGKVDLSTYEAEPTLNHWGSQLQRLRHETTVRSINRDLNNSEGVQAWRLSVRRNGEGYRSKPETIVSSSVTGVLNQCSSKLRLPSAARRLYTDDGTQILHMDQLKQWLEKAAANVRKGSLVQKHHGKSGSEKSNDKSEMKVDKANDGTNSTEGTPDHSTAEYGTEDLTKDSKKKKQAPVLHEVVERLVVESQPPPIVQVWISCGENFVNPNVADKMAQDDLVAHTERNARNLDMDTQRHVVRQIHGRRRGRMDPAELTPTKDAKRPVVVTGGWTAPTNEEGQRMEIYNQMKETQVPKRPRSATRLQGSLYKQPQMKRITVRAADDQATSVYAWGDSLESLLDDAASRLGVSRIARLFYTKDGEKIKDFEKIERNMELLVRPKRPGSTIRMKTAWARTRKSHGAEATEIVLTSPRSAKSISYAPPTNQLVVTSSSSSESSDDE